MSARQPHPALVGLLLFCGLTLAAGHSHGELPEGSHLGGHLKTLNLYLEHPPITDTKTGEVSSSSLRLDLLVPTPKTTNFEFAIEGKMLYADPDFGLTLPGSSPNRRLDLEHNFNDDDWFRQQLAVDRLNLQGRHFGVNWTLGRQAIGFGRISLFSPLDIIAPFPPDALDTEVRPGVDAIRASHYFGLAGQAGATLVFGQHPALNSYLIFGEGHFTGIDLLTIAGQLRDRPMAGGGFATQLGGMGVKVEATCYQGQRVGQADGDLKKTFTMAGAEVDYRFDNGLVLFMQYLYNGAGVKDSKDYLLASTSAPIQEGLSYLLGLHYVLIAPGYELHPLVTLNGLMIWNLSDDSFMLRPLLHLSLSDNLVLELFWNFTHGAPPQKNQLFHNFIVPRSEFGTTGDSGGLFLKYFF